MSSQDHSHSRRPSFGEGASRSQSDGFANNNARAERGSRSGDRPRFNSDRGPREERSFGGSDRGPRGPRRDEGFGGGDRPRFNNDRGPREERSFGGGDRGPRGPRRDEGFGGGDRPRFNSDRGPREERSFGGSDRAPRGPRREGERPRFNKERPAGGGERARHQGVREERPDYANNEGEIRRNFSGIRTYRAPASLKGKAAPIKVIRPDTDKDTHKN